MKILVIAAHPDDEVLGCGGSIQKFLRYDDEVEVLIMDKGRKDPLDQKFDTKPIVYWITKIEEKVQSFKPHIVFTHHLQDSNRDHSVIAEASIVACRTVKEIYAYTSITTSQVNNFKPNMFIVLEPKDIEGKISAMETLYKNELRSYPHPRSPEGIKIHSGYMGLLCGVEYAEGFETIRRII
jgi:LmbE family N-acetylglucosaminyl deacetylase